MDKKKVWTAIWTFVVGGLLYLGYTEGGLTPPATPEVVPNQPLGPVPPPVKPVPPPQPTPAPITPIQPDVKQRQDGVVVIFE